MPGAAVALNTTGALAPGLMRRAIIALMAVVLALTVIAVQSPAKVEAATYSSSEADQIVRYLRSHIGKRFRMGAEGMRYFDCSGLVYRVYAQAGLLRQVGGGRMLAAQYYRWFQNRGMLSKSNGRVGDVVFWRKNGRIAHTGVYIGGGMAISALVNPWGVYRHRLSGIGQRFAGFGHTRIDR